MSSPTRRHRRIAWTVALGLSTIVLTFVAPELQPDVHRLTDDHPWSKWAIVGSVVAVAIASTVMGARGADGDTSLRTMRGQPAQGSPEPRQPTLVHGAFPAVPPFVVERMQAAVVAEALRRPRATISIIGEPGTGKTQIAAQVVARADLAKWFLVAWIPCDSRETMLDAMAALATRLQLCSPAAKPEEAAAILRNHLQSIDLPSLLIFDNVVDSESLSQYRPSLGMVSVVLTSFDRNLSMGQTVLVDAYTNEQARAYLADRLGRAEDPSPILHVLDRSPLGLSHAAAILLALPALSYGDLAHRLAQSPLSQALPREESSGYPRSVAEAILFALELAESRAPGVRRIGQLCAVVHTTGVPFSLAQSLALEGSESAATPELALAALERFSLAEWARDGEVLLLHNLVRKVFLDDAAAHGDLENILRDAAGVLIDRSNHYGSGRAEWERRRSDVEHAHSLWALGSAALSTADGPERESLRLWFTPVADVAAWAVGRDADDGRDERASRVGEVVLSNCLSILPPGHPVTLKAYGSLAFAYLNLGRFAEALDYFLAVARMREQQFDADHPSVFKAWNNVATAYGRTGRNEEAIAVLEPLFRRREASAGTSDEGTLALGNTLAAAYSSASRFADARDLLERLVDWCDAAFGPHHLASLAVRSNLAQAYGGLGDSDDQERLLLGCAQGTKQLMGAEHPNSLKALNNLAVFHAQQGNIGLAVTQLEEALTVARRALPSTHETLLLIETNLEGYRARARITEG